MNMSCKRSASALIILLLPSFSFAQSDEPEYYAKLAAACSKQVTTPDEMGCNRREACLSSVEWMKKDGHKPLWSPGDSILIPECPAGFARIQPNCRGTYVWCQKVNFEVVPQATTEKIAETAESSTASGNDSTTTFGEFEKDLPRPQKIKLPEELKALEKAESTSFDCAFRPPALSVRVVYTGLFRPIRDKQRQFESTCTKTVLDERAATFFKLFESEVLVTEGSRKRWVPVQSTFLQALKDESKKGQEIIIDVRYFGLLDYSPKYYMIEFDASPE